MASTESYKDFVLENMYFLGTVVYKPMMGEYLLYYKDIQFGGIYDDRLLVKKVGSNKKYNMQEVIPYKGAKTMYLVDDIDNRDLLREIVLDTCKDLKENKK